MSCQPVRVSKTNDTNQSPFSANKNGLSVNGGIVYYYIRRRWATRSQMNRKDLRNSNLYLTPETPLLTREVMCSEVRFDVCVKVGIVGIVRTFRRCLVT